MIPNNHSQRIMPPCNTYDRTFLQCRYEQMPSTSRSPFVFSKEMQTQNSFSQVSAAYRNSPISARRRRESTSSMYWQNFKYSGALFTNNLQYHHAYNGLIYNDPTAEMQYTDNSNSRIPVSTQTHFNVGIKGTTFKNSVCSKDLLNQDYELRDLRNAPPTEIISISPKVQATFGDSYSADLFPCPYDANKYPSTNNDSLKKYVDVETYSSILVDLEDSSCSKVLKKETERFEGYTSKVQECVEPESKLMDEYQPNVKITQDNLDIKEKVSQLEDNPRSSTTFLCTTTISNQDKYWEDTGGSQVYQNEDKCATKQHFIDGYGNELLVGQNEKSKWFDEKGYAYDSKGRDSLFNRVNSSDTSSDSLLLSPTSPKLYKFKDYNQFEINNNHVYDEEWEENAVEKEKEKLRKQQNNARERVRVRDINEAFKELNEMVSKRMRIDKPQTKLSILQQAVFLINSLEKQIKDQKIKTPQNICLRKMDKEINQKVKSAIHKATFTLKNKQIIIEDIFEKNSLSTDDNSNINSLESNTNVSKSATDSPTCTISI